MLSSFKNLFRLTGQVINKCEFLSTFENERLLAGARCAFCFRNQKQGFHTSTPRKRISRELQYRRAALNDAKKEGKIEDTFKGDVSLKRNQGYFPSTNLTNVLFGELPFKDIPIVRIKATRNNTLLVLSDHGFAKVTRTCGIEGFKNARKGTNVAAQTAGLSLGLRAIKKGYKTVRVLIGGLGAGRLSSIKGLQLAGLNIVSITDCTVDCTSQRPRKQRRL